jgi:hypothetical protein
MPLNDMASSDSSAEKVITPYMVGIVTQLQAGGCGNNGVSSSAHCARPSRVCMAFPVCFYT